MAGASYIVFGRTVFPHQLAIATLGSALGLTLLATAGGKKESKPTAPPIVAETAEEKDFISDWLKKLEEEKK
ncbi:uncharacterized protein V1510DRAFT_419413 [Dipodascopsis tothii]|uniref:uncharacterized protein n=1 Tax=Dipodascopsis tothii TaxID=44089 RepID=UPI0034CD8A84